MAQERRVSTSRIGRLSQLGRLAGGVAGGMVAEGARQIVRGQRPGIDSMLLTPANIRRVGDRLSEMRGAAMKMGQLLSMDSGELLPPQLGELLAHLREQAHTMPLGQVAVALKQAWGGGWEKQFSRFSFTPIAAASIGQVHRATLGDGRELAVKIQYPGIRDSIDSDLDNVAGLLRLSGLLPDGLDLEPLITEAKHQLKSEADYRLEAAAMARFSDRLAGDDRYAVPTVVDALTSERTLAMQFMAGRPIEILTEAPAAERNSAAAALLELALREVLDWGLVQTDPNFANYLYCGHSGQLQLLDFGASREYPTTVREALRDLLTAGIDGSDDDLETAAQRVGYLAPGDPAPYRAGVVALLRTATEPARRPGSFAFARSDLANRMKKLVMKMRVDEGLGRMPPPAVLFLHRKLGGLYLLFSRIRAELPVAGLVAEVTANAGSAGQGADLRQAV